MICPCLRFVSHLHLRTILLHDSDTYRGSVIQVPYKSLCCDIAIILQTLPLRKRHTFFSIKYIVYNVSNLILSSKTFFPNNTFFLNKQTIQHVLKALVSMTTSVPTFVSLTQLVLNKLGPTLE